MVAPKWGKAKSQMLTQICHAQTTKKYDKMKKKQLEKNASKIYVKEKIKGNEGN